MSPGHVVLCSTCGRTLNAKGECLACLVRVGFDQPPSEFASRVFGDFEIVQREDGSFWELGRGAMGVTYRAEDKVLNRSVALKVIDAPEAAGDGQMVRDRFLREARAAAAFRHPNVAGVFHFGASPDGDGCYYAMELVDGETLEELVRRDGPLKVEAALEIAVQVTRALIAAAAHGLIHRDLKPGNIMLTHRDGTAAELEVKVIDFGLAKAIVDGGKEMDLTRGGFIGTPAFASPEQFRGAPADARSDIYSLGATLWYALTGEVPYEGKSIEEIRHGQSDLPLPVERLVARKIPTPVIHLLRRILAVDPVKRPGSARELMEALESCRVRLGFIPPPGSKVWRTGQKFAAAFVGLAVLGAATFLALRLQQHKTTAPPPAPAKSIAVLPFENRSEDKANAYFADSIQDEILTRLSKIADLKVISRTSTQQYKSARENLSEIAKQLGVAHILEGSVQKSGDSVRVNVQLIKAANDSHVWANTFDRKLTDILSVESEVAKAIADQLKAKLTGAEAEVIAAKSTDNPEAYDAYLRGLAYTLKTEETPAQYLSAQRYLREAVRLDPKFALAWALLSYTDAVGYSTRNLQPTDALREETRQAAETALSLQPNLGEALLAKGYYHYACLKDYDTATRYLEQARQLLPNNSQIPESLAYIGRRRGQWDRSEAHFKEAERLNTRDANLLTQHAFSYIYLRRFPEALRKVDEILNITPDDLSTLAIKAQIAQAEGDLPRAAALLTPPRSNADASSNLTQRMYQAVLERNPAPMIPPVKEQLAKLDPASDFHAGQLRFWLGWLQELAGDHAAAQESWRQARSELEPLLKGQPQNRRLIDVLALTDMGLGDKAAAFGLLERALATFPIEKDALDGAAVIETVAQVTARMGERDQAISALRRVLSMPSASLPPITPELLRLDPMWDPLRGDPRFQELCKEKYR